MGVDIRLLGPPQISVDGAQRRLKGRKSWGLLAGLLLESNPTRRELADRLFADADDPMATLRWHLLQVRRAIAPAEIVESSGRLQITSAGSVDAVEVLNGAVDLEEVKQVCRGELLEGLSFHETPSFDLWISLQRNRVSAAVGDTLRWAATMLAYSNPTEALVLLERALTNDPFNDAIHELAIETYVAQNNPAAARQYADRVGQLYRREMGMDLPESILRPLNRPSVGSGVPRLDADTSARALMKVVEARLEANDYERAMDAARRAAASAQESGDRNLQSRALLTLARTLIHSLPGRDHESFGLLGRALRLAVEDDDPRLLADIECEIGFVSLIDGRYGAGEAAMTRSIRWAEIAGDPALQGKARTFRAISRTDRTDYHGAEADFTQVLEDFSPEAYRGNRGYARASLARLLLRTGRVAEARSAATVAFEEIVSSGWHGTAPWPLAQLGEALLMEGDVEAALETFQQGFAFACEYPDACWESISLRGLALCATSTGDKEEARRLLLEALGRANRNSDTWKWAVALVLTDLVEVEEGSVAEHVSQASRIASSGPMPDLMERLQPFL
jgi:DNA-binding SARP family transcriptional activator